jgi:hypothetical protein
LIAFVVTVSATVVLAQEPARTADAIAVSRLKDVASLQGPVTQPVVGYGLVVGLNKTGDKRQTVFSAQTLANMLERFGVAVPPGGIKIENVAAVLVTGEVGPYAQTGSRLDVTASSIGDAKSLQGGTLLPTPLRGPDGSIVALAQGPLSIGGFSGGAGGNTVSVNHLTVGVRRRFRRPTFCAFRCASRTSSRRAASPRPSTWSWARARRESVTPAPSSLTFLRNTGHRCPISSPVWSRCRSPWTVRRAS